MELQGKIIVALEPKQGESKKNAGEMWMSQDFVIETFEEKYPRRMVFNVWGKERIEKFAIKIGDMVSVSFDIDAREYNGKWFNSISAWKVEPMQTTAEPEAPKADELPKDVAQALTPFAPEVTGVDTICPEVTGVDPFANPNGGKEEQLPF